MTVKELKRIIKKLPDEMNVFMPVGEDSLITVCKLHSEVTEIEIPVDEESDETESLAILLLMPCTCTKEVEETDIDLSNQLN